jgi:predicted transposase YdaD
MSGGSGPHDAVFRRVLGEPANAASQLRAVLPAEVVARLDLGRLSRVSGSFVDADLRWRHSDLLFTAPLAGREAFIYVLVEHQSSADPLMSFRMLRYVVRIWDRYLAEHPEADRLPAVLPLVVHHNRRPWSGPTDVWDLVDLDRDAAEAVRGHVPRLRFLLDDLAVVDEAALRARPLTPPVRVTLLLLKIAAGNARLVDDLRRWAGELRAVLDRPGGMEDFVALLTYIQNVGEVPAEQLRELVAQLGSQAEEAYVTTAEMLRAEGRAEGEARGRAEGEHRGRAEALVQLLTLKFGSLPPAAVDAVHGASVDQLETWTGRVLASGKLDEVLR